MLTGTSADVAKAVMMSHHLDLVRSGVASIEEELQQRASLLAVDNANLRSLLDSTNAEVHLLRAKGAEFESMQRKMIKMQQQILATDKENATLKQTLRYLQAELIKSGKKFPESGRPENAGNSGKTPPHP